MLPQSLSSTRELQPPQPSDILRQLRAIRNIANDLERVRDALGVPVDAGLKLLQSTINTYLNLTGSITGLLHRGMMESIEQGSAVLPVAVETLLEVILGEKGKTGDQSNRAEQAKLEGHRSAVERIKGEVESLFGA